MKTPTLPISNHLHRELHLPIFEVRKFDAQIPWVGSLKWNIIYPCMTLLMIWKNFIMISYIWILNVGNGGNGIKIHARGMLLGHKKKIDSYELFYTDTHQVETVWNSGILYPPFENLDFRMKDMLDTFFRECFISGMKDEI
jgi:hypothetical protein